MLDLQRAAGNAAVAGLVQRQPRRRGAASSAITLDQLRAGASRFGVTTVRVGTLDDQIAFIGSETPVGRQLRAAVTERPTMWAPWDPGSSNEIYRGVLDGLEDFAGAFGGTPPVDSIFFFLTSWAIASVRLQWGSGAAEYGGGGWPLPAAHEMHPTKCFRPPATRLPPPRTCRGVSPRKERAGR